MVELALPRRLHAIGQRALAEAEARRAPTAEAEHLLLALLSDEDGTVATRLTAVGLDRGVLVQALDAERARSLGVAGIAMPASEALVSTPRSARPGWGASVRDVLRGADRDAARRGGVGALERELAIGTLRARMGTLPRALALAAVDSERLLAALIEE
jgi:ATP-dependent Clp protease ATP-binding subunit ClpA